MNKPICIIIDFDDTLVESNTARDVLREYVSKEYDEIADLYKTKKVNFKDQLFDDEHGFSSKPKFEITSCSDSGPSRKSPDDNALDNNKSFNFDFWMFILTKIN